MDYQKTNPFLNGSAQASYYTEALLESARFRQDYKKRKTLINAQEMPWEDSPQGRIKHIVHEKMNTREYAMEIYLQLLEPGGRSGKHRHLAEEVFFVLEGRGYDLHWDVKFDVDEEYIWEWEEEPKTFEWEEEQFVYIPPYTIHQHVNADKDKPASIITCTNALVKALGLNWVDQIENAPGYKEKA